MRWTKTRADLALSTGAQVVYKGLGYIVLAVLARYLTKAEFGEFMFAAGLAGLFVLFTEFGTSNYLIRAAGAAPESAAETFSEVFAARLPLMAIYLLAVNLFALAFKPDILAVIAITSVYVGAKDLYRACAAALIGLGRVGLTVAVYGSGLVILVALVLAVVSGDGGLYGILLAYCAWTAYILAVGLIAVRRQLGPLAWQRKWRDVLTVLRRAFALFVLAALTLLHFKIDTVMLGFMKPYTAVASYEAAAKLLEASQFLIRPLWMIYLPVSASLVAGHRFRQLRSLLGKLGVGTAGLGIALAIPVIAAAAWIIPFVFGSGFDDSVPVLRVLYLSVPPLFVGTVGTFVAVALHLERASVRILLSSVVANVVLNGLLIPPYGAQGAAWTTLATQTLVAVSMIGLNVRELVRLAGRPEA